MQLPNRLKTPSLLQRMQWVTDPVAYMESAVQQHADIFTGEIVGFGGTLVFVNHPQAIQEMLTTQKNKFAAEGSLNRFLQPLLGDYSIVMLNGDRHKKRRQFLMPSFHGERMRVYGELISYLAEKVFSELPINQPFLARQGFQEISAQVMLKVVFGLYEGERYQQIKHSLLAMLDIFRSPVRSSFLLLPFLQHDLGAWSPWGKFLRQQQQISELLCAEIAERRQKADPDRTDIVSLLMSSRDEDGQPMTDEELRDEIKTLMFAGYDTTATVMSWIFYWTHHKPEVKEKLLQELDSLGDSPDPMTIFRLPYLSAVCNESLRIYSTVMLSFPTQVQERVELLGHWLEPGTIVAACMYLTHQREDLYPQPKEFHPERFLERQYSPYEFMPFGGVRRCIGEAFAMFEIKLILATILSKYQFALTDPRPEKPQRRALTLAPGNGAKISILGRREPQTRATTPIPLVAR